MNMLMKWGLVFLVFVLIPAKSALAIPIHYSAQLNGGNVDPPNPSPGTGFAEVAIDIVAHTLSVDITFDDLLGSTTASHIHGPTAAPGTGNAGVITQIPSFFGFPLGVQSGTFQNTFDTTNPLTFNAAFIAANGGTVAGAEAALAASLAAGTAYLSIHTTLAPGGEIRGFLAPVPEPATMLLLGSGLVGIAGLRRKVKKQDNS